MQTCIAGMITHQPGLVDRDTTYGPGQVCNAVLTRGQYNIRCGFWRERGAELSAVPTGTMIALLQVNVVHNAGSWKSSATEATQIVDRPEAIEAEIQEKNNEDDAGTSITKSHSTDYDKAATTRATLAALAGITAPTGSREMQGVYELHNVAVFGVSSVINDGAFSMKSCTKCWRHVDPLTRVCSEHPGAGTANRWTFSLELADDTTSVAAMLFHDAASRLPFLHAGADELDNSATKRIVHALRAAPWSIRVVLKPDTRKDTTYLEVKRITQTIVADGIVETYAHKKAPS